MQKNSYPNDEIPSIDLMLSMSGLDYMLKVLAGELPEPPLAKALNFHIDHISKGDCRFRGTPQPHHCNVMGGLHGGWFGSILDSCMGCSVMTMAPKGFLHTTLEYKVNLTRGIPIGTEVIASGKVEHAGRTTGVATGVIRGASDGKLYATGSTTCLIYQPSR
jgi:uncharacterized protein (TIGR00369 family)